MLSVIVPVLNEEANIVPLVEELTLAARTAPIGEILYVDDGSTDATPEILRHALNEFPLLRVVRHERRMGQSAAFRTGAEAARFDTLVFMDGDGQNDPADIAALARTRDESGRANRVAVLGQRAARRDTAVRRLSSRLANAVRGRVLRDGTRDTGCSLKLIHRADYLNLPYFDHMHRFLPALLIRSGVELLHIDVSHRARERGVSKYGFRNRAFVGMVDLMGVRWLMGRRLPADYGASEITRGHNA